MDNILTAVEYSDTVEKKRDRILVPDSLNSPHKKNSNVILSYAAEPFFATANFQEPQMSQRFIKFIPSEKTDWLIKKSHCAFILLCVIASRARRCSGSLDNMEIGEAKIGDWNALGMTRQQYRTALKLLCDLQITKISETNRTRKNSTTGSTTEGTKVKLLDSSIWDINLEENNHCTNHCPTTAQPLPNHEQERIRMNKKKKEKIYKKEKIPEVQKIPFREFVLLTQVEYDKLVALHEKESVEWMLDCLNAAKGSHGYEYKSDYYVLSKGGWVFKELNNFKKSQASPTDSMPAKGFSENRAFALKLREKYVSETCEIEIDNEKVIFINKFSQGAPLFLKFKEFGFQDQMKNELGKRKFRPKLKE